MGGPPFPSRLEGKSFQGCLLAFPGIVWDFSPTRPPCKCCCKCSPLCDVVWEFHNTLGTMPHFPEGLKPNQWTRLKHKTRLLGPIFLLPRWDFSPLPSLREPLLLSVRSAPYVLRCVLSDRMPQAPLLSIWVLAVLPGRWRGLAGMRCRSGDPVLRQTFLPCGLAQTAPLLWGLKRRRKRRHGVLPGIPQDSARRSAAGPCAEAAAGARGSALQKHPVANLYVGVVSQRASATLNDSSQTATLRGRNLFVKINQLQNGVSFVWPPARVSAIRSSTRCPWRIAARAVGSAARTGFLWCLFWGPSRALPLRQSV